MSERKCASSRALGAGCGISDSSLPSIVSSMYNFRDLSSIHGVACARLKSMTSLKRPVVFEMGKMSQVIRLLKNAVEGWRKNDRQRCQESIWIDWLD